LAAYVKRHARVALVIFFAEHASASTPEYLESAYRHWAEVYREKRFIRCSYTLGPRRNPELFDNIVWGAGSVLNLFPQTDYVIRHPSFDSEDDAWLDDWYKVGCDLYEGICKAKPALTNARHSSQDDSGAEVPEC
jgi:hypothetical protein